MKISTQWTDAERLAVCNEIATEMMESYNNNAINNADVADWAQRLAYVACGTPELLERNRRNILIKYLREVG